MSTLTVQNIQGSSSSSNTISVASGHVLTQPGSVIQTVFTASDTKTSSTANTYVEYLSLAITPKLATSKIFVRAVITFGGHTNSYASGKCDRTVGGVTTILKNGTHHWTENRFADASFTLHVNSSNDTYKMYQTSFDFLDSPNTTSACTYKLHYLPDATQRTACINRSITNPGDGYNSPANTTMTLMEIAQ